MARETGLEPATSGVTGRRSNQLSYTRIRSAECRRRKAGDIGRCGAPCQPAHGPQATLFHDAVFEPPLGMGYNAPTLR